MTALLFAGVFFVLPGLLLADQCEEKGCPESKSQFSTVHVMPHSHNDVGWLQTIDELYKGYVRNIYETSTECLVRNTQRRYVSCENAFFSVWWKERSKKERKIFRSLVRSGHIQFVGGGWVQNDEAVTHYTGIIDQMTLGLRFLNDTFGQCGRPTIAWQADPFGHSRCQANLFAQMGFDGLMIGRISRVDLDERKEEKKMLFVWNTEPGHNPATDIFTWVPPTTYYMPPEFCFDRQACPSFKAFLWRDLDLTASSLFQYMRELNQMYATSQLGLLYGGDLSYYNASKTFEILDELVARTARKGRNANMKVAYSTPRCYIKALHRLNKTWPTYRGDFFPYTDEPMRTWTGFYTSRPALKFMVRYANGFLQACKQLAVGGGKKQLSRLQVLKEAVASLQHHDGITGTSKEYVTWDYIYLLWKGIKECEAVVEDTFWFAVSKDKAALKPKMFHFCHLLNISECEFTETNTRFSVLVYNPMSRRENVTLRFPVTGKHVVVEDTTGMTTQAQVVPVPEHRTPVPERQSNATLEAVTVVSVPALGFSTLHVAVATTKHSPESSARQPVPEAPSAMSSIYEYLRLEKQENFIENNRYRLEVDMTLGLLSRLYLRNRDVVISFSQSFQSYDMESPTGPTAGQYVFAASTPPVDLSTRVIYKIVKGPVVEEIHQIYNSYISQVIRLYRDSDTIEFQWTVGPVVAGNGKVDVGSDIVTLFQTGIENNGVFYTDGNGKQNMKRRNCVTGRALPVPSNYYPVVSWIYIQDEKTGLQLSVIPDRAQGGSSMSKGAIELMVHRRHFTVDNLGNPEDLDERGTDGRGRIVTGKHRVFFGTASESVRAVRLESLRSVYLPITVFFDPRMPHGVRFTTGTILGDRLPDTLHLLTLEPISRDQILFRVEHIGVVNETIRFSLQNLLRHVGLEDIRPTLLGGNQYLEGSRRLHWKTEEEAGVTMGETGLTETSSGDEIVISPGDIRTFVSRLKPRKNY